MVLTLLLLTNTCYGQAQDGSRFLKWLGADSKALVHVPSASTLLYSGAGLLSLTILSTQDTGFNHELQEDYSGRFADYVDATNNLGDPRMNFVAAGIFGASLLTNSNRFQDAAFTSFESFAMAGLINTSIKFAIGRARPEEGKGKYTFDPFSYNKSFPSGHTNKAFAILTPWAMYYPHVVTYGLLFVGAGGTALARMAKNKHWFTDVVAGGAIGFFTARWLTKRHQNVTTPSRTQFSLGAGGFRLAYSLD